MTTLPLPLQQNGPPSVMQGVRPSHLPMAEYLDDVRAIAGAIRRTLPKHVELDDLIQAGCIGLIDALNRCAQPGSSRRYLKLRIHGAIYDSLRQSDALSRYMRERRKRLTRHADELTAQLGRVPTSEEVAGAEGISVSEYHRLLSDVRACDLVSIYDFRDGDDCLLDRVPAARGTQPDDVVIEREHLRYVNQAMDGLRPLSALVIRMHYFQDRAFVDIARELGVSKARVSQLHTRGLRELKAQLKCSRA